MLRGSDDDHFAVAGYYGFPENLADPMDLVAVPVAAVVPLLGYDLVATLVRRIGTR